MNWQVFADYTGAGIAEIYTTASSWLSLDDCLAARNDVKVCVCLCARARLRIGRVD